MTGVLMATGPSWNVEAKTALALSQPSMSLMVFDETPPVTIRVTARLTPCSTK